MQYDPVHSDHRLNSVAFPVSMYVRANTYQSVLGSRFCIIREPWEGLSLSYAHLQSQWSTSFWFCSQKIPLLWTKIPYLTHDSFSTTVLVSTCESIPNHHIAQPLAYLGSKCEYPETMVANVSDGQVRPPLRQETFTRAQVKKQSFIRPLRSI